MLFSITLSAQFKKNISKNADKKFNKQNYSEAAQAYIKALSLDTDNDNIISAFVDPNHKHAKRPTGADPIYLTYQLAESFRLDHNYKNAQMMYEKCINLRPVDYPLLRFWYGVCLKANNEPEKAIEQFSLFLQKHKGNDEFSKQARSELNAAQTMINQKLHPTKTTVTKLPSPFNMDDNSFALQKLSEKDVLYTGTKVDTLRRKKINYSLRLFTGDLETNTVSRIETNTKKLDIAASSMSADGLTLYFTSWTGRNVNAIYYITRTTASAPWSSPVLMEEPVNEKGYGSKHPYITRDGSVLLFASDRPGSFGKFDIWMVRMNKGKPTGQAINLGRTINTSGEEASPFYDEVHHTLYFSSDSKAGLGGLDIYRDTGDIKTNKWTGNINLGYPINSARDELYYTRFANSDTVYFSSNRESSSNILNIYAAVEILAPMETEPGESEVVAKVDTVKPVPPPVVTKPQPPPVNPNTALLDSINASTIGRFNTYYDLNSSEIRDTDADALNKIISILNNNPDLNILVASFGDCKGSEAANIRISRARSRAVRRYLRKHGISSSRINLNFFGKEHNVLPCKDDQTYDAASQLANRRSDIIITKEKNPKWKPSGKEVDINDLISKIKNGKDINEVDEQQLSNKDKRRVKRAKKERAKKERAKKERAKKEKQISDLNSTSSDPYEHLKKLKLPKEAATEVIKNFEVIDSVENRRRKGNTDDMMKRTPKPPVYLFTKSDSVRIDLYDNGVFDYDSISVIYNKKLIINNQLLKVDKPISFYVKVDKDANKNVMVFFAENLGLIPPNSALMVITDGEGKRTEVSVTNDLEHNTIIYFIKQTKN
jgi:outer membrane protein OmpA-like peptidoglycan-associated protein